MDELLKMGREAGIAKLAELESIGKVTEYLQKVAPEYVDIDGEPMKFCLLRDLGWIGCFC